MISTSFSSFDPSVIPWQDRALDEILNADYTKGTWEFLLSGAVGSAKTTLGAHLSVRHCLDNVGARCMVGRRARPDLRRTIFQEIMEHIDDEDFVEDVHYRYWEATQKIEFMPWKSEMIPGFWADKKYKRFRSMKLSMALIEELTETENQDKGFLNEIIMRLNRIPGVDQNLLLAMTNPDSPSHWAYDRWMINSSPLRKVFYSVTEDNPFLSPTYLEKLKSEMDPKLAERMLYGKWIELSAEKIYYAYDSAMNFRDQTYTFNPSLPVDVMHDFNIGHGKPMSAAIGQVVNGEFHIARSILIDGARTSGIMEEIANTGDLERGSFVRVYGDASGKHSDTRNIKSDYDIIKQFLANYRKRDGSALAFEMKVPMANPPIRKRHNDVNASCCDVNGVRRLFVYKEAKEADTGFRLTNFRKSADLLEDDSLAQQHVTTAIGYWVHHVKNKKQAQGIVLE